MSFHQIARKARTTLIAGVAALASTTFQNGCSMNQMNDVYSLLNELSDYASSYDSTGYNSGYNYNSTGNNTYGSSNHYSDWSLLDLKSG